MSLGVGARLGHYADKPPIPLTIEVRTSLGPCQIDAPLGAGGVGEVYEASDTKLNRTLRQVSLGELNDG